MQVKLAVGVEVVLHLARLDGHIHALHAVPQQGQVVAAQAWRGQLHCQAFQRQAHLKDVLVTFAGHRRDPHGALLLTLQHALGHQPLQGRANRHRAGAPLCREVTDLQPLPRLKAPCQQARADVLIQLFLQIVSHALPPSVAPAVEQGSGYSHA